MTTNLNDQNDLNDLSWYRLLTCDPDESEQELVGLLGSEWHQPPVVGRMHVASCEGVSQVHVELNLGGRTLTFYLGHFDARDALYSLAFALGADETARILKEIA